MDITSTVKDVFVAWDKHGDTNLFDQSQSNNLVYHFCTICPISVDCRSHGSLGKSHVCLFLPSWSFIVRVELVLHKPIFHPESDVRSSPRRGHRRANEMNGLLSMKIWSFLHTSRQPWLNIPNKSHHLFRSTLGPVKERFGINTIISSKLILNWTTRYLYFVSCNNFISLYLYFQKDLQWIPYIF